VLVIALSPPDVVPPDAPKANPASFTAGQSRFNLGAALRGRWCHRSSIAYRSSKTSMIFSVALLRTPKFGMSSSTAAESILRVFAIGCIHPQIQNHREATSGSRLCLDELRLVFPWA
jgi:hypothetical protein